MSIVPFFILNAGDNDWLNHKLDDFVNPIYELGNKKGTSSRDNTNSHSYNKSYSIFVDVN